MKQLYVVRLEQEIIVVAESAGEAEELARDDYRELDEEPSIHASEMRYLPGGWTKSAIPWGERMDEDPDRTVGKWIEMGAAPHLMERKPPTPEQIELLKQSMKKPEGEK